MSPRIVLFVLLLLPRGFINTERVVPLINNIPSNNQECPVQSWNPTNIKLGQQMLFVVRYSTRFMEDSIVVFHPDLTIHRQHNFSKECEYNLTYRWDAESLQYWANLQPGNKDRNHSILVSMNDALEVGLFYDCRRTEPDFVIFSTISYAKDTWKEAKKIFSLEGMTWPAVYISHYVEEEPQHRIKVSETCQDSMQTKSKFKLEFILVIVVGSVLSLGPIFYFLKRFLRPSIQH